MLENAPTRDIFSITIKERRKQKRHSLEKKKKVTLTLCKLLDCGERGRGSLSQLLQTPLVQHRWHRPLVGGVGGEYLRVHTQRQFESRRFTRRGCSHLWRLEGAQRRGGNGGRQHSNVVGQHHKILTPLPQWSMSSCKALENTEVKVIGQQRQPCTGNFARFVVVRVLVVTAREAALLV